LLIDQIQSVLEAALLLETGDVEEHNDAAAFRHRWWLPRAERE
jgi:hypothetical protein